MSFWNKLFGGTSKPTPAAQVTTQQSTPPGKAESSPLPSKPSKADVATRPQPTSSPALSPQEAIQREDWGRIKQLLIETPSQIANMAWCGSSVLFLAVLRGQLDVAKLLLANGANVNAGNGDETPLFIAAEGAQSQYCTITARQRSRCQCSGRSRLDALASCGGDGERRTWRNYYWPTERMSMPRLTTAIRLSAVAEVKGQSAVALLFADYSGRTSGTPYQSQRINHRQPYPR